MDNEREDMRLTMTWDSNLTAQSSPCLLLATGLGSKLGGSASGYTGLNDARVHTSFEAHLHEAQDQDQKMLRTLLKGARRR